jgi:hypothetical protein
LAASGRARRATADSCAHTFGSCSMSVMSLAIDVDEVTAVLLADGWHKVAEESFDIDSYEFVAGSRTVHGGGDSDVCASGFQFKERVRPDEPGGSRGQAVIIRGPLSAVLAVRTTPLPPYGTAKAGRRVTGEVSPVLPLAGSGSHGGDERLHYRFGYRRRGNVEGIDLGLDERTGHDGLGHVER